MTPIIENKIKRSIVDSFDGFKTTIDEEKINQFYKEIEKEKDYAPDTLSLFGATLSIKTEKEDISYPIKVSAYHNVNDEKYYALGDNNQVFFAKAVIERLGLENGEGSKKEEINTAVLSVLKQIKRAYEKYNKENDRDGLGDSMSLNIDTPKGIKVIDMSDYMSNIRAGGIPFSELEGNYYLHKGMNAIHEKLIADASIISDEIIRQTLISSYRKLIDLKTTNLVSDLAILESEKMDLSENNEYKESLGDIYDDLRNKINSLKLDIQEFIDSVIKSPNFIELEFTKSTKKHLLLFSELLEGMDYHKVIVMGDIYNSKGDNEKVKEVFSETILKMKEIFNTELNEKIRNKNQR